MKNLTPEVTGIMITCGRHRCIGESIHSFNRQTYPNKRLIIIDTHPMDLVFETPLPSNVLYMKANSHNFRSLGDKTRFALNLVESPLMCMWEDDDIWLPFHLEQLVKYYVALGERKSSNPIRLAHHDNFFMEGGNDGVPISIKQTSNLCWCRYIFEHSYGHWQSATSNPFDVHYMDLPFETVYIPTVELPGYIYRWNNGQCHMSGLYGSMPHEELYRKFEDELSKVDLRQFPVTIGWKHDYVRIVRELRHQTGKAIPDYL